MNNYWGKGKTPSSPFRTVFPFPQTPYPFPLPFIFQLYNRDYSFVLILGTMIKNPDFMWNIPRIGAGLRAHNTQFECLRHFGEMIPKIPKEGRIPRIGNFGTRVNTGFSKNPRNIE
jgi:hypothetical protein